MGGALAAGLAWIAWAAPACSPTPGARDASAAVGERADAMLVEDATDASADEIAEGGDAGTAVGVGASPDGSVDASDPAAERRRLLRELLDEQARFHLSMTPTLRASFEAICETRATKHARENCRADQLDEAATIRLTLATRADAGPVTLSVAGLDAKGAPVVWYRVVVALAVEPDRLVLTRQGRAEGTRKLDPTNTEFVITSSRTFVIEVTGLGGESLAFERM